MDKRQARKEALKIASGLIESGLSHGLEFLHDEYSDDDMKRILTELDAISLQLVHQSIKISDKQAKPR